MTLKQRIEEIAIDLAYWSYHNTVLEDYKDTDKKVDQATTDILKVIENNLPKKLSAPITDKKNDIFERGYNQAIQDMKERLR